MDGIRARERNGGARLPAAGARRRSTAGGGRRPAAAGRGSTAARRCGSTAAARGRRTAAGACRLPASSADRFLVGPESLKLDIEEHFIYSYHVGGDIEPEGRRVCGVGVVGKVVNLLICRALCVGLPNEGPVLQVRNAPGYILRFVRERYRHREIGRASCRERVYPLV